jgi:hypothetical protein
MPAPWAPDATKDGTLNSLITALAPNLPSSEAAWHISRGEAGFTEVNPGDGYDNLCYSRFNWDRLCHAAGY